MTGGERLHLKAWFDRNYDRAMEATLDALCGQECE
jgi:hypothetical protein